MAGLLLLATLEAITPSLHRHYPAMDEVRCLSVSSSRLYIGVRLGVYVVDRADYSCVTTVTSVDGLSGEVKLCCHNPSRNELLILTDTGLYSYIELTDLLRRLKSPPDIRSIGVSENGVWLETTSGYWRKHRLFDEFEPSNAPTRAIWYGARDSSSPRDYSFLVPWVVLDEQLQSFPMTLVRPDASGRRLFVATAGRGVMVYSLRSGLAEHRVQFGPADSLPVQFLDDGGRLWLRSPNRLVMMNGNTSWQYYSTQAGLWLPTDAPIANRGLLTIGWRESINAIWQTGSSLIVATDSGIYRVLDGQAPVLLLPVGIPVQVVAEHAGRVLFGTSVGLFAVDGDSLVPVQDPWLRSDWGIWAIAGSVRDRLWFGVRGGVLGLDTNDVWNYFVPPGFDLEQPVQALANFDNLVFAAGGSRVAIGNVINGTWTFLDEQNGLGPGKVTSLFADSTGLWVAQPGLITHISRQALQ